MSEPRKRIRYATGGPGDLGPSARYAEDDPDDPAFVPLEERGERARARFWALQEKRRTARRGGHTIC